MAQHQATYIRSRATWRQTLKPHRSSPTLKWMEREGIFTSAIQPWGPTLVFASQTPSQSVEKLPGPEMRPSVWAPVG